MARQFFPGKFAGASLKPESVHRTVREERPSFPGKFAGASLKQLRPIDVLRAGVVPSPANSPGPH